MKRQKYTVCACNMFSQVIYCSSAQNSEESSAGACSFCGFHALRRLADRMLASHWPSRNYCTILYIILKYMQIIIVQYNVALHCYITRLFLQILVTMPPSLLCHFLSVPKGGIVSKFDCTYFLRKCMLNCNVVIQ